MRVEYSGTLPFLGTVLACLDTAASTPPADDAWATMNRAQEHLSKPGMDGELYGTVRSR